MNSTPPLPFPKGLLRDLAMGKADTVQSLVEHLDVGVRAEAFADLIDAMKSSYRAIGLYIEASCESGSKGLPRRRGDGGVTATRRPDVPSHPQARSDFIVRQKSYRKTGPDRVE